MELFGLTESTAELGFFLGFRTRGHLAMRLQVQSRMYRRREVIRCDPSRRI